MSITEVAKRSGSSVATVSRVINENGYVAEATAARVRAVIREMGYVPRALRPGPKRREHRGVNTGTALLLSFLPHKPADMYKLPAFPALLGGVHEALDGHGMNLQLAHCPDGITIPPALTASKVDGVLIVGSAPVISPRLLRVLESMPVVWMFRAHNDPERRFDHVLYDNREVGELAARYLYERGHRHVGIMDTQPGHDAYSERRDVFCAAGRKIGMEVKTYQSAESLEGAAQQEFMESAFIDAFNRTAPLTAFFCEADDRMLTAHMVLNRIGKRSEKIELVGCNNDNPFLSQMTPRPATVDIKLADVGRQAVELLWQRLGEPIGRTRVEILIKPEIVPGDSAAPEIAKR